MRPSFYLIFLICLSSLCSQTVPESIQKCIQNQVFSQGKDPYRKQYEKLHTMMREPVVIAQEGDWYCLDNFRASLEEKANPEDSIPVWNRVAFNISEAKSLSFLLGLFRSKLPLHLGHLFAVVEFAPGQILSANPEETLNGLVVSFEALRQKSEPYDMVEGMKDRYPGIYVLGSYYDVLQKAKLFYRAVEVHPVKDPNLAKKFLNSTMNRIVKRPKQMYHTILNSCITKQYDLLNEGLDKGNQISSRYSFFSYPILRTFSAFFPAAVESQLKEISHPMIRYENDGAIDVLLESAKKGFPLPFQVHSP